MLTQITSTDNAKVRLVRKLGTKKGRIEESRFVVEGINLVSELIRGGQEIEFVIVSDKFDVSGSDERLQTIREYIYSPHTICCELKDQLFSKLTDAEHGIEILAVVRSVSRELSFLEELPKASCILVCDRIQDPGNMGTMIRTAVAAGYAAVVTMPGTVDVFSPKVLRSTAGMVFEIPIVSAPSEDDFFRAATSLGFRIAVTVPSGGRNYYDEDLHSGIALVIGNEGGGISDSIIDRADVRVTLPMKGKIESLNAAVAAAILMYEALRSK